MKRRFLNKRGINNLGRNKLIPNLKGYILSCFMKGHINIKSNGSFKFKSNVPFDERNIKTYLSLLISKTSEKMNNSNTLLISDNFTIA